VAALTFISWPLLLMTAPAIVAADGSWATLRQGPTCEAASKSIGVVQKDRAPARAGLSFDAGAMSGRIASLPTREQINLPVQEQLIVELYSK